VLCDGTVGVSDEDVQAKLYLAVKSHRGQVLLNGEPLTAPEAPLATTGRNWTVSFSKRSVYQGRLCRDPTPVFNKFQR
jgi:hypothetical protein